MNTTPAQVAEWHELKRQGLTVNDIARQCGVSPSTVRYHINPVYRAQLKACNDEAARVKRSVMATGHLELRKAEKPAPVIVETFGNMPVWPKPKWLASFEDRMK
jgi:hypothetical protein